MQALVKESHKAWVVVSGQTGFALGLLLRNGNVDALKSRGRKGKVHSGVKRLPKPPA